MFTHVKSTIRHIAPDGLGERSLIKVVYVVLEPQYQSALSAAVRSINQHNPNIAVEVSGYLIEELRDPQNYADFQRDVAVANIFIASLIFLEDLADKIVSAVEPYRDRLDVAVVFPSMPQVMRLNKIGEFLHGSVRAIEKRDRPIHEKAQGAVGVVLPRRNAEVVANLAQGA
ncbi:DUF3479 domain-containing protein [Neosynechococcus sphagnicola]|uniref:DUF3479 domain-containing protein n=1 Tax=Neosynechococcus sphagnicola TaxID=1501145 RepID=UPI000AF3560E